MKQKQLITKRNLDRLHFHPKEFLMVKKEYVGDNGESKEK